MTPPLPPPKGMFDDGALPGHPGRQGADLVERDVRRVADAAFGGTARDGVLYAIAGEDFQPAVVELDGMWTVISRDGIPKDFLNALVESQLARRPRRSGPLLQEAG